jgi:hypothetical protein
VARDEKAARGPGIDVHRGSVVAPPLASRP